MKKEMQKVADL